METNTRPSETLNANGPRPDPSTILTHHQWAPSSFGPAGPDSRVGLARWTCGLDGGAAADLARTFPVSRVALTKASMPSYRAGAA